MPTRKSPRKGSLQFWPRKRAKKFLPRVNWDAVNSNKKIGGFIGYKVGMVSVSLKDNTPDSMTKGKTRVVPATIIECPPMKIFSIRFYKNGKVLGETLSDNLEKELKRKVNPQKKKSNKSVNSFKDYDEIKIIVYSQVKKTSVKKTPDLSEISIPGTLEEKSKFVKENLGKEIKVSDVFENGNLVDLRGLTKGKGLSGPVKRFGITLKSHKSEKGRRRPGSLGPWHPARVTFRVPQAGQLGMFTRVIYNNKILELANSEKSSFKDIKNFGNVKTDYIIVNGSVQGSAKRQLLITQALRPTKKQSKKNFEVMEIIK